MGHRRRIAAEDMAVRETCMVGLAAVMVVGKL